MIAVLKKLYQFAGDEQKNINKSIFWGFFYAVFHMFQIAAIYFVVLALTGGDRTYHAAWTALLLLVFSIAGGLSSTVSPSFSRHTRGTSWLQIKELPSATN